MPLKDYNIVYKPMGEQAVLVEWPKDIDEAILEDIIRFEKIIRKALGDECELVPAYHSLLVIPREKAGIPEIMERLGNLYPLRKAKRPDRYLWKIPVCYDEEFGPDLAELSKIKEIPADKIIELHTEGIYTVFAIGFLPGFMYLGGLDKRLFTPRKSVPRLKVAGGAVGIGGKQTGMYPQESPGGWNIIGNSPVKLFDPGKKKPCKIRIGDKVRFYRVKKAEHELIGIESAAGVYSIKKEKWHD